MREELRRADPELAKAFTDAEQETKDEQGKLETLLEENDENNSEDSSPKGEQPEVADNENEVEGSFS